MQSAKEPHVIPFRPMLMGKRDVPPVGDAWCFEAKFDGWRVIAEIGNDVTRLWTRHGRNITKRFPELQRIVRDVAAPSVLDCELVILDDDGRPVFEWIPGHHRAATLFAFDVLRIRRSTVVNLPLVQRQAILKDLLPDDTPAIIRSRTFDDGHRLLAQCEALRLEGIVAKRKDAPYRVNARSDEWLKIRTRFGQDVIRERMRNAHRR